MTEKPFSLPGLCLFFSEILLQFLKDLHYHLQVQANSKKNAQKGKVDLCMINSSKVLIYLTLLNFIFYCTLVSNAKGNLAESNKSDLWNLLSYRGLPYLFEVRTQTVRNDCKISEVTASKFNLDFHSTSTTLKGLSENLKKMSWDHPLFPIEAKNSIPFFVQFFLS